MEGVCRSEALPQTAMCSSFPGGVPLLEQGILQGVQKLLGKEQGIFLRVSLLEVTPTACFLIWLSLVLPPAHFFLQEWETLLCLTAQTLWWPYTKGHPRGDGKVS